MSAIEVQSDKPLVWLHGEVKTPPWSLEARREAGYLLRRLQLGDLKICRAARVPTVCAHSMRGLFATLGIQTGAVPHVVVATVDHESPRITEQSYAQPGSAAIVPARRAVAQLLPN